jgi:hypothetical protein
MKPIKHILYFLLILILQLSFANSFAGVFADKKLCVGSIEFSETSKPVSGFEKHGFKENIIFKASFLDVVPCSSISLCDGYAELVESWKVLEGSADLRKNIDALETIEYYTKNVNSNVDELTSSFKSATNKEDWFSGKIAEIRSKARSLPGTSSGNGVVIEGQWMRGTDGNIGLFPKRIADKLKGKSFENFAEFRHEFWKAVADDPELFAQFGRSSQAEMLKGNAPFAKKVQQVGGKIKYEIHHKTPIHDGGGVYDIDNLVIVTPRYHKEILDPAYHFKKN